MKPDNWEQIPIEERKTIAALLYQFKEPRK
jgi:hypothetical protein